MIKRIFYSLSDCLNFTINRLISDYNKLKTSKKVEKLQIGNANYESKSL